MSDPEAPYQRIAAEIRHRIQSGTLKPGDRVPSTRSITQTHGVAMATATKALALLQQERLIHPHPGIGNLVGPPPHRRPGSALHPTPGSALPPQRPTPGSAVAPAGPRRGGGSTTSPRTAGTGGSALPPAGPGRGASASPSARSAGSASPSRARGASALPPSPREVGEGSGSGEGLLSREKVVRVAIGIADVEGMGALSMRRIASELGVATMALYRYVGGKERLILQMVDAAVGDFPFPAKRPANWRDAIEQAARLQWAAYRQHLWLASAVTLNRPQVLPNLLPHTDAVLRAVAGFGIDPSTAMYAAITVFGYVRGVALNLEPEVQAEQDTGMTADEWVAYQVGDLADLIESQDLAGFRALAVPNGFEFDYDLDQLFEFGLTLVLDGLATRLGA